MDADLIERIYESSFVPERWPETLFQLGRIAGAGAGWMFVVGASKPQFVASGAVAEKAIIPTLVTGEADASQRAKRLFAARHAGFLREIDLFTEDELKDDPFYKKYIYPLGGGYAAASAFMMPTGERLLVSLERAFARGPVESERINRLDFLRPHLARALLLAARLRLEVAQAAGEILSSLGLPALVLDAQGKVLAANSLIEDIADYVVWRALDRVSAD